MLDESKLIKAKDIVEDPDLAYMLNNAHIMIYDSVSFSGGWVHLMTAVEILFQVGWEVVNFQTEAAAVYAMMRNTNAKRKNG